jgi:hypothetical protein
MSFSKNNLPIIIIAKTYFIYPTIASGGALHLSYCLLIILCAIYTYMREIYVSNHCKLIEEMEFFISKYMVPN